jgi:hypothetical protein
VSAADEDVVFEAEARFRARVVVYAEQALLSQWGDLIAAEAKVLTQQGPAAYIALTDALASTSTRARLDVELRRIFGGGS